MYRDRILLPHRGRLLPHPLSWYATGINKHRVGRLQISERVNRKQMTPEIRRFFYPPNSTLWSLEKVDLSARGLPIV